jgi:hypothetical protein
MKRSALLIFIVMIVVSLLGAIADVLGNLAAGGQLQRATNPVWLALVLAVVLAAVFGYWLSRRDGDSSDDLNLVVGKIAETQRGWVRAQLDRRMPGTAKPIALTWADDAHLGTPHQLDELVERFLAGLRVSGAPAARAIIVGQPGSGKTMLAALLIDAFLNAASPPDALLQVPVLFRLGGWNPSRKRLAEWLPLRLVEDHQFLDRKSAEGLLARHQIMPVLDGLDEIHESLHAKAYEEIDKWLSYQRGTPFLLTCREKEYDQLNRVGEILPLVPRVNLQPVGIDAALAYLDNGPAWASVRRRREAEGPRGELAQALNTPLMIYLAKRVFPQRATAGRDAPKPEWLADRAALPTAESIKNLLLDTFVPAVLNNERELPVGTRDAAQARRPPDRAEGWLEYLAAALYERGEYDIVWHRLGRLAGSPRVALPIGFGVLSGLIVVGGARLVGLPTGVWWGLAAGAGFAILLWLLGQVRSDRRPGIGRVFRDGVEIGLFGGLAAGLPGAFVAPFLGAAVGSLAIGVLFGLVAGALANDQVPTRIPGGRMVTGLVAGIVGWVVGALVCGFPEGVELHHPFGLPGGPATSAWQAWRSALGFGLTDQLRIGLGFSLVVGLVVGLLGEIAQSGAGGWLATRSIDVKSQRSDSTLVACGFAVVGGLLGLLAGWLLAGSSGLAGGLLVGAGLGGGYGTFALRTRPALSVVHVQEGRTAGEAASAARSPASSEAQDPAPAVASGDDADGRWAVVRASLANRVQTGLVGGLLGGALGGLVFPGVYAHYGAGRLGTAGAGAADGMEAGLALGLVFGLVFGLRPMDGGATANRILGISGGLLARVGRSVTLGLVGGGTMGIALTAALQGQMTHDWDLLIGTYLAVGLVLGAVAALVSLVDERSAQSPQSRLAAARLTAVGGAALVGMAAGVGTAAVTNLTFGVIAAVMVGTMTIGGSRWGAYTAARLRLASARRLPWRLSLFLENMAEVGVLRQAGPVYQFRHAQLRDRLADHLAARRAKRSGAPAPIRDSAGSPEAPAATAENRARQTVRRRLVRFAAPLIAAAVVAAVLPTIDPKPDRHRYAEFYSAATSATYADWWVWYSDQGSQPVASLAHGYAVWDTQTVSGPGQAGIYLVDIAYVLVSCSGVYGFYRSLPLANGRERWQPIEEGFSAAVHTESSCRNTIEVLVGNGSALCFANEAYLGKLPVPGPIGRPLPPPQLVVFDNGGRTDLNVENSGLYALAPG